MTVRRALCESERVNLDVLALPSPRRLVWALIGALCLLGAVALSAEPTWVITEAQEAALKGALGAERPIAGLGLRGATIEGGEVTLRYGAVAGGPVTATLTLVHPSVAPEGARRLAQVAIAPTPGPAPEALVDGLARRLEGAKGLDGLWTRLEGAPKVPEVAPDLTGPAPSAPDPHAAAVAALRGHGRPGPAGAA